MSTLVSPDHLSTLCLFFLGCQLGQIQSLPPDSEALVRTPSSDCQNAAMDSDSVQRLQSLSNSIENNWRVKSLNFNPTRLTEFEIKYVLQSEILSLVDKIDKKKEVLFQHNN